MTEALASKTCTPCRGGIAPLTREQAEVFHAQAPDWQLPLIVELASRPAQIHSRPACNEPAKIDGYQMCRKCAEQTRGIIKKGPRAGPRTV
jgi:hypothetical protein